MVRCYHYDMNSFFKKYMHWVLFHSSTKTTTLGICILETTTKISIENRLSDTTKVNDENFNPSHMMWIHLVDLIRTFTKSKQRLAKIKPAEVRVRKLYIHLV